MANSAKQSTAMIFFMCFPRGHVGKQTEEGLLRKAYQLRSSVLRRSDSASGTDVRDETKHERPSHPPYLLTLGPFFLSILSATSAPSASLRWILIRGRLI